MPDFRYALRNGDKTSTGGVLIAAGTTMSHHGAIVGVEGDYATCPACKSGGRVMNDCYPSFDIGGKQILVSGARVYCKCARRPVVLPSQADFAIEVNNTGAGAAMPMPEAVTAWPLFQCNSPQYDQQIQLLDEMTCEPLTNRKYRVTGPVGYFEGRTDSAGFTRQFAADVADIAKLEILGEDA
ncbi:conserved hypothetical protein [Cupriavidus taiwanensis]|uniref:PAAR domain-containing protein n=1 Tax=Cupriavidus taiwanensis TaxID=164546 RepID=A0A976ASY7_9BURK|nr:PAAR domain-containing protein [Cupriavidus taiwanensis]SOZ47899.1 conserved hypothetical protein [Cupriavidus taiwanensis]SOZ51624.1 conserved hypothetical protein [Cupriavidus taiwanensis]